MITAEELATLTTLGPDHLSTILKDSGYLNRNFESARFLGITNGGQFCYRVSYYDDGTNDTGVPPGKVFVTYNHAKDMTADF
jgi:hypothetical protein